MEGIIEVSATVIVAVFTAIITYILGRRQNKLQEQQVKLQEQQTRSQEMQTRLLEYEAYKQLYSIIKDINQQSELILNRIYEHFSNSAYREMKINLIKVLYQNINVSYVVMPAQTPAVYIYSFSCTRSQLRGLWLLLWMQDL